MNSSDNETPRLRESAEDYLEAIGTLCRETGQAQVSNIAQMLNVKKPSVTAALRHLRDEGLIEYKQYSPVTLTEKGQAYAKRVMMAHRTLRQFLNEMGGLSLERADQAACHLEHWLTYDEISHIAERLNGPM
ncbi:MAG: metal-dependent transcriptional regulator [Akkermansia sp.]